MIPDSGVEGFQQPAGTVPVNFYVDDSANRVYGPGDLQWQGSFEYDATTRIATFSITWAGPFPPLFDDGPWNAGGHEPIGSTAGDHVWGVTVFIAPPVSAPDAFEYGLKDASAAYLNPADTGSGWLWRGVNGKFEIAPQATAPITAVGQVLPTFGTTDVKLVLDMHALQTPSGQAPWDTSTIQITCSVWAWNYVEVHDDGQNGDDLAGDGKFTVLLSSLVGPGKRFTHSGLLDSGQTVDWIWSFGPGLGVGYLASNATPITAGVSALTRPADGSFVSAMIESSPVVTGTEITVP